jgi:hypothetical protein
VQEHLVLVCELLRANLFEFQRFTRASGEPPYFTLPRVRSIARQVRAGLTQMGTTAAVVHQRIS